MFSFGEVRPHACQLQLSGQAGDWGAGAVLWLHHRLGLPVIRSTTVVIVDYFRMDKTSHQRLVCLACLGQLAWVAGHFTEPPPNRVGAGHSCEKEPSLRKIACQIGYLLLKSKSHRPQPGCAKVAIA